MNTLTGQLERFRVTASAPLSGGRVLAVDVLRGFDMIWIIGFKKVVKGFDEALNTPATNWLFAQLDHAEWYGFTFYDIIMPLFLFLVGISMVFSMRKRLSEDSSKISLWKHILIRFILLWILGMVVQGKLLTYDIDQIKLFSNTLQAIAAGYLIASVFILYLPVVMQIAATIGLMLVYWGIFSWVPVPGFGAGLYTPDGNIAIYLDKLILGPFQDGTTYTWILSSLNFGATTMLGVFTGYLFRSGMRPTDKFIALTLSRNAPDPSFVSVDAVASSRETSVDRFIRSVLRRNLHSDACRTLFYHRYSGCQTVDPLLCRCRVQCNRCICIGKHLRLSADREGLRQRTGTVHRSMAAVHSCARRLHGAVCTPFISL
jgi:hypothetical protein